MMVTVAVLWILAAMPAGCRRESAKAQEGRTPAEAAGKPQRVKEAAVAGLFYPKDPKALADTVDLLLAKATKVQIPGRIRGLVCPHAGYEFSGPVAANAYKLLAGRDGGPQTRGIAFGDPVRTVIILAPSHYAEFRGVYVSDTDAYRTPLGLVAVSPQAGQLARSPVMAASWKVQRPPWARLSPQSAPAAGADTPETWEHSAEVQLPFLQRLLKDFAVVEVVYGQADPVQAAKALEKLLDDRTVIVASTDLSHYFTYEQAQEKDRRCVEAICALDEAKAAREEACGMGGVLTLMHLARQRGWKARLLDYRNSGDTGGEKARVVGYAAIAFYDDSTATAPATASAPATYSPQERRWMLDLARRALKEYVSARRELKIDESKVPGKLAESKGCFVTLTEKGELRGCIGHIQPQMPLYQAVIANAINAATRDPRFGPVQADELDKIEIEVSVLTVPEPLAFKNWIELLERLEPHRDGVVLKIGSRMATYLPQVWEQIPDKEAFLSTLSQKAGCPAGAWKGPAVAVYTYRAEAFKESEK